MRTITLSLEVFASHGNCLALSYEIAGPVITPVLLMLCVFIPSGSSLVSVRLPCCIDTQWFLHRNTHGQLMTSSVKTPALRFNWAVSCPDFPKCDCVVVNPPNSPFTEQTGFSVSKVSRLSTSLWEVDHFILRLLLCLEVTESTSVQYLVCDCVTSSC